MLLLWTKQFGSTLFSHSISIWLKRIYCWLFGIIWVISIDHVWYYIFETFKKLWIWISYNWFLIFLLSIKNSLKVTIFGCLIISLIKLILLIFYIWDNSSHNIFLSQIVNKRILIFFAKSCGLNHDHFFKFLFSYLWNFVWCVRSSLF